MANPVDVMPREHVPETYLGDAVYASYDGFQIWLRTGDGNNQRIALDSHTCAALMEYVERIREANAKQEAAAWPATAAATSESGT